MWIRASEKDVRPNWIAIFSYSASLAVSVAIWTELFWVVHRLVK
jgi:hypothetical protein